MQLPCRTCTLQNGGIEVRKMLKEFTLVRGPERLWEVVKNGQDLECIK